MPEPRTIATSSSGDPVVRGLAGSQLLWNEVSETERRHIVCVCVCELGGHQFERSSQKRMLSSHKEGSPWANPGLHTATPPIDTLKCLVSPMATGQWSHGRRRKLIGSDAAIAHFKVPSLVSFSSSSTRKSLVQAASGSSVSCGCRCAALGRWRMICSGGASGTARFHNRHVSTCMSRHGGRYVEVIVQGATLCREMTRRTSRACTTPPTAGLG